MKTRLFTVLILVIILGLLLVWSVAAQGPAPSDHRPPAYPPGRGMDGSSVSGSAPTGGVAAQGVSAAVALGSPGTVYHYTGTFGETGVPYTSTSTYLNRPYSLAVDKDNNVYVGETEGKRVLKFNASGVFQAQVGYTGLCWVWNDADSGICDPFGLAVGPDGNLWIAEGTNRVSVFTYTTDAFTYTGQLGITWESGDDNDHFNQPEGVAFDSAGRIYVADRENNRVQIFDSTGIYSATLGNGTCGTGDDEFCRPHGLAIGSGDVLYVADSDNHRVQVFRLVGDSMVFSQSITTGAADFGWVPAVAVDANHLYVADNDNNQVHVFNRGGVFSSAIAGDCGGSNDWFCWPMDIAVDAGGNVYVPSTWEDFRLMKCSGGPAWTCNTFAGTHDVPYITDNYHYFEPNGIAVSGSGDIFLAEGLGRRLIKLNSSGTPQWAVGEPGIWSSENDHFGYPEQVALDSNGRIYVADADHHRVQIFNSDDSYYATLGNEDCNPGNGLGNKEFCWPRGVAVGSNGRIYVADTDNHRVQVFDSNQNYLATLGTSGESGDDANHFNWPRGVAVDSSNNVYVADTNNNRIQKCTVVGSSGTCSTFAGVTGEWGDNLDRLGNPQDIAVSGGKVFVAECGPDRVQVFDTSGAYLTTIGNSWGDRTGELRCPKGVDVDASGNLYVTDKDNARIQKFAPGVPGWAQVNINGFGDRNNGMVHRMSVFSGYLYASISNGNAGSEVWRSANGTTWNQVNAGGFGVISNTSALVGESLNGYLYVGTSNSAEGAEIWRCATCNGTDWQRVVSGGFDDPDNESLERIAVFSSTLYASTINYNTGAEVWKSSTGALGSWTQANTDGFGDSTSTQLWAMEVFSGYLYAGTAGDAGSKVWRTNNGTTWSQVNSDGFDDPGNYNSWLESFKGYLYAFVANGDTGVQVWRCDACNAPGDWEQVAKNGFLDSNNTGAHFILSSGNRLYACAGNDVTGGEVWQSTNGTTWSQTGVDGLGDSNNWWIGSGAVFNNRLFLGTANWANGGEVWSTGGGQVYLPVVLKNR
jgi:hypothetical protein